MKNKIINVFLLFSFVFLAPSCVTKRIGDVSEIPPNVATFSSSKKEVWTHLIQIIKNELLMPFQYASYKKGHFVCREIADADEPDLKMKVQLSGFLTFDGSGTVVTLFKQVLVWDEEGRSWRAVPSDFILETSILKRLEHKLSVYGKK